jgi:hypothetical protein
MLLKGDAELSSLMSRSNFTANPNLKYTSRLTSYANFQANGLFAIYTYSAVYCIQLCCVGFF